MPGPHASTEVLKTIAVTPQNAMTSRTVHKREQRELHRLHQIIEHHQETAP